MGLYDPDSLNQENEAGLISNGVPQSFSAPEEPNSLSFQEQNRLQSRIAEQSNWFVSLLHNGLGDWRKEDPSFNPYAKIQDTKYANYPEYFLNADNEDDIEHGKKQVDEREEYQNLAARAPSTAFWSAMAWGVTDPLLVIPGIGSAKLAMVGRTANVAKSAIVTGAISTAAMGAEEAALYGGNPDRTAKDAIIHTAVGGVVGAAFGGLIAKSVNKAITKEAAVGAKMEQTAGESTYSLNPDEVKTSYNLEQQPEEEMLIKAQSDAMIGVKDVLNLTDDSIKPNIQAAKANIADDEYKSVHEMLEEHNMEGATSPLMRSWRNKQEELMASASDDGSHVGKTNIDLGVDPVLDKELEEALKPKGGVSLEDLEKDTKGIGAGHISYDARIQGMPDFALKSIAIPHVINPSIEGMASSSGVVRDFTTRIGYVHYPLKGKMGEQLTAPFSLESAMQKDLLQALDFNKAMDRSYLKYLQIDPDSTAASVKAFAKSKGKDVLNSKQFDELTIDAMNHGDKHVIPEVQERAQYTRNLFNDAWKKMQDAGLVDKNRPPNPNYFKITYDIPHIINNRIAMEDALTKLYANKLKAEVTYITDKGIEKIDNAIYDIKNKSLNWEPRPGETLKSAKVMGEVDINEARQAASESVDNILQMGDKSLELGDIDRLNFTRGADSLRPRKIVFGEEDYDALKEFMVKDFRKLTHNYLAGVSRAVNYKTMLDNLGVDSLQDVRVRIKDEFKEKINKVRNIKDLPQAKKDKMIAKLNKQAISSEKLFNDLAAISLGQFKKRTSADAFWRTTNQYNVARLYGGIVVSSLGDPTAMLIKNSIPNAVWNGWLSELKQIVTGTKNLKTQDYRNALTAIQNEMDDLVRFMMNPDMTPYGVSKGERIGQVAGNIQMKASGMTMWNNFWQRASHNLAEHNILKHVSKQTQKGEKYLKEIGIDNSMAKRISKMQNKYGEDIRGTHISNSHRWSDVEAADYFNNAIRTEVHKSPLITEMLDIPRFFQKSEMRKTMALGKGFSFGAISKLTLSAAARHDPNALAGIMTMVMAGMVVKTMQDKIAGRDSNYSSMEWLRHGIDKSGVLGMLGDPMMQMLYAKKNMEDWGGKAWIGEPIDYMLGPNASVINPAYHAIIAKMAGSDMDKKTQTQLKALIPYNNLWYKRLLEKKK